MTRTWTLVVALLVGLFAQAGHAQLLSPGKLAKAHRKLEGLSNCTKCHEGGKGLSDTKCLACHKSINSRRKAKKGFHGREGRKDCSRCHAEHRGVSSSLIDWGGSQASFRHARTGWPLKASHGKVKCTKCHEKRRIKASDARKLLKDRPKTLLGLSTTCKDCHFDEHRGQLDADCKKCHDTNKFKRAPGFNHNRDADFARTGKHRRVRCSKCHRRRKDTTTAADVFPAPVNKTFLQLTEISHRRCTDCHQDPHNGERGRRCTSCHTTKGWDRIKQTAKDIGFHDKTDFPLKGSHQEVPCAMCHGPNKAMRKAVFKDIAHKSCSDCHFDAHLGAFDKPKKPAECVHCHTEEAFVPAMFELEDHGKARFPLDGAHQAVACNACHLEKKVSRSVVRRADRRRYKKLGRPIRISSFPVRLSDVGGDCKDCHDDAHRGQFKARVKKSGCKSCHQTESFSSLLFDHNRDSSFPLEGKHASAECGRCHGEEEVRLSKSARKKRAVRRGGPKVVQMMRYRPLASDCTDCHDDTHRGQFVDKGTKKTDCRRCHTNDGFSPSTFDHDNPELTDFRLNGKHRELDCKACHQPIASGEEQVAWYRGLPKTCAGCHHDEHEGRFKEFTP